MMQIVWLGPGNRESKRVHAADEDSYTWDARGKRVYVALCGAVVYRSSQSPVQWDQDNLHVCPHCDIAVMQQRFAARRTAVHASSG